MRNIAILALIALAVVAVPGGAQAAGIANAVLYIAFAALIAYFAAYLYRDHRIEIYGLGDLDRATLYVSFAGIVVLLAGAQWFDTTIGALIGTVLLVSCVAGLIRVFQVWRSY